MIDHALILGGARSGKSRFAERLALSRGLSLVYVATAEAHDIEMTDRIARHRADRGADWHTVEEPINLPATIANVSRRDTVVLVDCLTLWLSNMMLADHDIEKATTDLLAALAAAAGPVLMVTNEVGLGIIPKNALARRLRDEASRMNQCFAAHVPHVAFISAGLPMWLKGKLA
jgi:adenosylcobinamide kinase / adenosylcobinamide-phosphate guanylyltransferase